MNNNNNTTRMDANNPIQYNNNDNNDNKNNNNKKEIVDVYIICKRVTPSKRITFTKKDDVQKYLLNLPYQLTPDHFLYEISKERTTEEYYISKLFESLLIGPKIFGSLHHFNQILTMTSDEFNLLVHGNGSRNKDSQTDKIKKSLSQLSPDFVFQKLYPKSSSFVIEFLNDFHKNNINNNNNNNNNNNINDINNNYNNDNNYNNNNFNNDNNNYLQVERPHKPQTNAIDENAPPVLHFIENCNDNNNENLNFNLDHNDHQNNNNDDPMLIDNDSIMEHFPPQFQPDLNLPFDPFDHFSIGEHGEGFDGEKLRYICSMEQIDSESLDSFINSF